jgi:iron transport multicopper oxidase
MNAGTVSEYSEIQDISLVPVNSFAYPPATRTIELDVLFDTMDDGTNRAMFNQTTFDAPIVPAIFSALTLGSDATVEQAYGPLSYVVAGDGAGEGREVIDLVVRNGDDEDHTL